ncbi:hypothetical protein [Jatrophihabitans fulvus]
MRRTIPGLSVPARLSAAAALCVVPLGLVWTKVEGFVTNGYFGPGYCDYDGYCQPGVYTAGVYVPGSTATVAQSPARVFLVAAAVLLVVVATRSRTAATLRLARLATASVVLAAVLAASHRATLTLACTVGALALVGPLVLPRIPGVLVSRPASR